MVRICLETRFTVKLQPRRAGQTHQSLQQNWGSNPGWNRISAYWRGEGTARPWSGQWQGVATLRAWASVQSLHRRPDLPSILDRLYHMRTLASCLDFFLSILEYSCPHQAKTVFLVPVHPMASENQDEQAGPRPSEGFLDREKAGPRQFLSLPCSHMCAHTRVIAGDKKNPRATSAFSVLAR